MAKFKYRMQSILEVKKKLEEQAKNEFAAARAVLNEEEEKLEQLKKRKEAYEDEGRALRENTLNIMDIIENKEALLRMDEFIADQQLNVKRAQDRMEEARLALQNAMQESKTQEKLREKAFEQFVKEENKRESKEIDELVSYTYGRKA
jgi:flagellar FliJ protein